jgi:hypothetical protein
MLWWQVDLDGGGVDELVERAVAAGGMTRLSPPEFKTMCKVTTIPKIELCVLWPSIIYACCS